MLTVSVADLFPLQAHLRSNTEYEVRVKEACSELREPLGTLREPFGNRGVNALFPEQKSAMCKTMQDWQLRQSSHADDSGFEVKPIRLSMTLGEDQENVLSQATPRQQRIMILSLH